MPQMRGATSLLKDIPNGLPDAKYTIDELHKLYIMYFNDPTEVDFVDNCLEGDFTWWEKCKQSSAFKGYYKDWRLEARQRYLHKNVKDIACIAGDETNKARFAALKYLCDTGFVEGEEKRKAGRPSKEEVEGAKEQLLREDKELSEVFGRIGIGVN